MKGIIIVNAYSTMKSSLNQAVRLQEELNKMNVSTDIVPNDRFICYIDGSKIVSTAADYDFCIYLDKDKYISALMEKSGLRLFNSHDAVRICDDKYDTFIALSQNGISMPKSLPGLLCYTPGKAVKEEVISRIENELSYPVVVKNCYGSLGQGVFLAKSRQQLEEIAKELMMQPHLFQQFISSSCGRDVRVIVIGGKVVAAMERVSKTDFRSNIELGGEGHPFVIPASFEKIACDTAKILNLDYCGIDLLFSEGEEPLVCEVNSNAFFGGIEKVTGVNVAKIYAEYIVQKIKNEAVS